MAPAMAPLWVGLQLWPHSATGCLAAFRSELLPATWLSLPLSANTPTYVRVHLFLSAHVSLCVVLTCLSDSGVIANSPVSAGGNGPVPGLPMAFVLTLM